MQKKVVIKISGSDSEAISALTRSLKESNVEVFKTPLFCGNTTLAFPEGLYDVSGDAVIMEILAPPDSIQKITSNLAGKPGIILS